MERGGVACRPLVPEPCRHRQPEKVPRLADQRQRSGDAQRFTGAGVGARGTECGRKVVEGAYSKIRGAVVPAELFDEVLKLLAEYRAKK